MITDRRLLGLAVAHKLASPEELELWRRGPDPDPCDGMDDEERVDYAIAHAASGVSAELPPPTALIAGRPVPPPPGRRPRRSPRGHGTGPTETPLSVPESHATGPEVPTQRTNRRR